MTFLKEGSDKGGLRGWFEGGGWDRYDSKGNKIGKCGGRKKGEAKPKCFSKEKAAALGKKGRAQAVRRKRREDPNPLRRGKPIDTPSTKKGLKMRNSSNINQDALSRLAEGVLRKLQEKKDACYNKVKASAKVWPSAYASGRLVQCRKKGASNYGNKRKDEGAERSRARRKELEKNMSPLKMRVDVAGRRSRAAQVQADQTGKPVDWEAGPARGVSAPGPRTGEDAPLRGRQRSSTEIIGDAILEALKCWKGYKRVKGKTPGTPGSCTKVSEESRSDRPDVKRDQADPTPLARDPDGRAKPPKDDDFDPHWSPNNANDPRNKRQRFRGRRGPAIGSRY